MIGALGWGSLAASSLVVGVALALHRLNALDATVKGALEHGLQPT